ncbi:MAG: cytochrome c biogenesis heme-transporting ATPase CcmA [Acidiferrobacterales bacterium]
MQLSVSQLSCHRGDRALFSDISFSVPGGKALHLAGPNGSGKTTLLRTLAGLTDPVEGRILLNDTPITELGDEYRGQLAFVGHLNGLQPELNIRENLQYQAALGIGAGTEQIDDAIHRVALTSRAHLQTKLLSQGQKRRAALARLFLGGEPIWLLDEPVTALDVESIGVMVRTMKDHLDGGGILIYTSHQPLDLGQDRVIRMELGR